jgi:DHA1 family inner membrane transport protein
MGVLPEIAHGLGSTVPTAGRLISAYALGVVVGVPILSFFAAGLPRKALLLAFMVAYAVFNAASAGLSSLGLLTAARFLDGLPHGAYFGIASIVAADLVSPANRGRAVAGVMMGLSVANVAGVPVATWLGQAAGWRAVYVAFAALAVLTVVLIAALVPHQPADRTATGRREARAFFTSPQVWLTLLAGAVGFGGLFCVYSYIASIVTGVAGLGRGAVPLFTLAFGAGMVLGTWAAGALSRWPVLTVLIGAGAGTSVALVAFYLLASHGWLLLPAAVLVTALGSVLAVNLQLRLMDVAGDAVTLGAAMNHASLNVANALGAFLGGAVIDAGHGYRTPALVGAGLAALGAVILVCGGGVRRDTWRRTVLRAGALTPLDRVRGSLEVMGD